jgi:type IV secretory pathway VirB3-like protein
MSMEHNVEPKLVVPVVAGNTRIILSVPEWAASLIIFVVFLSFAGNLFWFFFIVQVVLTMVYVLFLSKLEENILNVLIQSAKMPNIVYGSFNKPMPLDKKGIKDGELKVGAE